MFIIANVPIKRPTRNGSQIRIYVASNSTLVWWVDSRYSPDVYYINNTLVFYVRNYQWTLGETYCITLLEGVGTADQYCGMESPGYGGEMLREKALIDLFFLQVLHSGDLQFGIRQCHQQQRLLLQPLQEPHIR